MLGLSAIVLLCLTTRSLSAPLDCETLTWPLDQLDRHHLEGRWVLAAGSLSELSFLERLRHRDSATASFSNNTGDSSISFRRSARAENKCQYASLKISLESSRFNFDNGNHNITTTFIRTSCPDCILMSFDVESGKRLHLYLFSRRRQLEQQEMEEFRGQVECLNLPPPVVMDPTKELCPEQTDDGPTAKTDKKMEGKTY